MWNAVVPAPVVKPFYYKIKQPTRGVVSTFIIAAVATSLYWIGGLNFWWASSPLARGGVSSYTILPLALIMAFCWSLIFIHYLINWPFQKFSQPAQGALAALTCLVLGGATYAFAQMANWTDHLFDICICWLFWIIFLGPFGDNPIVSAYQGKQPISGITGFIATLGLGLLTWWLIPESFLGMKTGFPWIWFFFAIVFFRVWPQWPFPRTRAHVIIRVGYLSFFTFVLLWVLDAVGLNFFTNTTRANVFILVWMTTILVPVRLFQFWPFHHISEVPRGWLWLAISTILAMVIYCLLASLSPHAPELRNEVMTKTVAWGFCFFLSYYFYWGMAAGQWAPPP